MMRNKNIKALLVVIFTITTLNSCGFFNSEDFKKLDKINLSELNKKLESEKIYFDLTEVTTNGVTENRINVMIINIKNKNIDLKKVNKQFFELIEKNKVKLKKYDQIKFWYISDYSNAKLRILYVYNNKKEIIDVSYR